MNYVPWANVSLRSVAALHTNGLNSTRLLWPPSDRTSATEAAHDAVKTVEPGLAGASVTSAERRIDAACG